MLFALVLIGWMSIPATGVAGCDSKSCPSSLDLNSFVETQKKEALKTYGAEISSLINDKKSPLKDSNFSFSKLVESLKRESPKKGEFYPKILIFVSFSMPISTLRSLGEEARKVGGVLVLRGLKEGSFSKTQSLLKEVQHSILIDPKLFKRFQIQGVPTFVMTHDALAYEEDLLPEYDTVRGNITLKAALEILSGNRSLKG